MTFSPSLAVAFREALGLSRRAAAKAAGVSRQGLINIETGESAPNVTTLSRLASAYHREPGEFFIDTDSTTRPAACAMSGAGNDEVRGAQSPQADRAADPTEGA